MNPRILFLDDEPLALQGLQRMLRNMRASWDMIFVEDGARALDLLEQSPFDVVVSDMLMPGLNGAEFLHEVRKRHPRTIRLILSGHAERELILQCIGSAHQYLPKPCPPETLKSALGRAANLTEALGKNDALRKVLFQLDRFPSVPALYIDLAEALLRTEAPVEEVTNIVVKDPGLTAAALKLVNSAFVGAVREISNAAEAVSRLGLDTFRTLVFNLNAFSQFDTLKFRENHFDSLWQHSLEVARMARRIARTQNVDNKTLEEAYTAGLLHDVGKFIMSLNFPEKHAGAIALAKEQKMPLWSAEQHVFGISHAEVGAYLLSLWGLPASVVEAVASHHCPARNAPQAFAALTAVHIANALTQDRKGFQGGIPFSEMDSNYLAQIGLLERVGVWRKAVREDCGDAGEP